MKKILYLPSWYPDAENPLAGSFFREQALLAQEKFDVKVLALRSRELKPAKLLLATLVNGGMSEPIRTEEISPPECIEFRQLVLKRKRQSAWTHRWQLQFLRKCIASLVDGGWKPDVIHAHSLFGPGIYVEKLASSIGARSVLTEHESPNLLRLSPFFQTKALEVIRAVDALACVSQHLANTFAAHGVARKIDVCGNWINEAAFHVSTRRPPERPSLLHVSNPAPVKGSELLFQAVSLLRETEAREIEFTVVSGNEANRRAFEKLANQYGVRDRFTIKGCVTREEIPEEYARHTGYISTSYSETFGVAIREALMSGIPVITTACGGIDREIDESNGVVVPTGDVKALCEAIRSHPKHLQHCDPVGIRERCIENHGRRAFLEKLSRLYAE